MIIPWTVKKQLAFFIGFIFVAAGAVFLVWQSMSDPSCFDNKRNQNEENIDCGGVCEPCVGEVKDTIVLWTKVFKIKNGVYEAAAMIDNPNIFLGISSIKYKFKLYDENNILVAIKDGETFINPGGKYVFFETGIYTGNRVPKRVFVEFEEAAEWKIIKEKDFQLIVSKKRFSKTPFPKLTALIKNESLSDVHGISAVAVIFGADKNAKAVSSTKIDFIKAGESREIVFSWPYEYELGENISGSKIFIRTNLTK